MLAMNRMQALLLQALAHSMEAAARAALESAHNAATAYDRINRQRAHLTPHADEWERRLDSGIHRRIGRIREAYREDRAASAACRVATYSVAAFAQCAMVRIRDGGAVDDGASLAAAGAAAEQAASHARGIRHPVMLAANIQRWRHARREGMDIADVPARYEKVADAPISPRRAWTRRGKATCQSARRHRVRQCSRQCAIEGR